eukprot:1208709-Pyramimonas_sp.AAC.1
MLESSSFERWRAASPSPSTRDDVCRSKASLANARKNCTMHPKSKIGGVPGVLPIFEGMRARFTTAEN